MSQRLGRLLTQACERKAARIGKDYTSYKLAQESNTTQSYAYRALHGKIIPSRDMLLKWCDALECTVDERAKIFHAAGYLSPEEMQKELEAEEEEVNAA
jgi:transcriptional regulator with XRE-family HTH domain